MDDPMTVVADDPGDLLVAPPIDGPNGNLEAVNAVLLPRIHALPLEPVVTHFVCDGARAENLAGCADDTSKRFWIEMVGMAMRHQRVDKPAGLNVEHRLVRLSHPSMALRSPAERGAAGNLNPRP